MKLTLVKWSAKWCAPCAAMKRAKTCEKLAAKFNLTLVVKDADEPVNEAEFYKRHFRALPTLALMKGDKVLSTFEGAAPMKQLEAWLGGIAALAGKEKEPA